MPRQQVKIGDFFWVPIEDDTEVLGQVVEVQREVLNSITCAFFDCRKEANSKSEPDFTKPISIQFVTKDLFLEGKWKRHGNLSVQISGKILPYRETEKCGWVGAKIIGSGICEKFLSAYYGLRDWKEMHDPNYYQNLLLPGVSRNGFA